MEISKPPYTWRNIICAALLGVIAAGYWVWIAPLSAEITAAELQGNRGEAGSMFICLLVMLGLYTLLFFLGALSSALQRGSKPMQMWLLLGLLPTLVLGVLTVVVMWHHAHRVV
ncbi:hypothetical protein [Hymenobacter sp. PAMC 26628]|uniref:hypothetical protein n=1 Tax=Hymenobacter sp. PAMC 26628 TaxID=1484118 RepID=UPI000770475D|nr:hypothetical protein [Hymenobacter sp. PAMC 26628]AMJ65865.1 hypothetical protein AXW84_10810 [Hymenobacter sp. PAMC 26628]